MQVTLVDRIAGDKTAVLKANKIATQYGLPKARNAQEVKYNINHLIANKNVGQEVLLLLGNIHPDKELILASYKANTSKDNNLNCSGSCDCKTMNCSGGCGAMNAAGDKENVAAKQLNTYVLNSDLEFAHRGGAVSKYTKGQILKGTIEDGYLSVSPDVRISADKLTLKDAVDEGGKLKKPGYVQTIVENYGKAILFVGLVGTAIYVTSIYINQKK